MCRWTGTTRPWSRGGCDEAAQGEIIGVIGFAVDITERRRAEEAIRESEKRYRLLVESVPHLAWRISPDGMEMECNRLCHEYSGLTPAQVRAHGWLAAVHPDDLFRVAESALHAANSGEPYELEYRLRRASDGSYRWHLARAVPLLDEDGQISCWIGSATDIEDLKRAQEMLRHGQEEQLQRHRAELAHVGRLSMMGEMAASLVHELNQPLHAVNNYANGSIRRLMKMRERDEDLVAAIRQISDEANRAAEIVRRVKRFIQKRDHQRSEILVNRLVEEVVLLSKADADQREAKIALGLSENVPPILGDPIQIEQVIMNLLRNALEAMDETPPERRVLEIRTGRNAEDGIQVDVCARVMALAQAGQIFMTRPVFDNARQLLKGEELDGVEHTSAHPDRFEDGGCDRKAADDAHVDAVLVVVEEIAAEGGLGAGLLRDPVLLGADPAPEGVPEHGVNLLFRHRLESPVGGMHPFHLDEVELLDDPVMLGQQTPVPLAGEQAQGVNGAPDVGRGTLLLVLDLHNLVLFHGPLQGDDRVQGLRPFLPHDEARGLVRPSGGVGRPEVEQQQLLQLVLRDVAVDRHAA